MANNESLDIIDVTGKKSRGGLNSYGEMDRSRYERVRGEFLASTYKARITFSFDSIRFNKSCVNLFPANQHIVINIDEVDQRIIIEPCMAYDRDSLKFAILKNERNEPRKCMARIFCAMIYDLMGWNRNAKYKIMAIFHEWGDKQIIVFNLDECLQVFSETSESVDGKKKRKPSTNMPEDWRGRFGHKLEELDTKNKIDTTSTLITIDNKTGERHENRISPKLPTPEEFMHQPYGGMRPRQEESGVEEI